MENGVCIAAMHPSSLFFGAVVVGSMPRLARSASWDYDA
jgi:hypothetical protein